MKKFWSLHSVNILNTMELIFLKMIKTNGQAQWFIPLISATWEAAIRRTEVQDQSREKVRDTPPQQTS
jgi:hypothetical protein